MDLCRIKVKQLDSAEDKKMQFFENKQLHIASVNEREE